MNAHVSGLISNIRNGLSSDLISNGPPPSWFRWRTRRRWRATRAGARQKWILYAETFLRPALLEDFGSSPNLLTNVLSAYQTFLDRLARMDDPQRTVPLPRMIAKSS